MDPLSFISKIIGVSARVGTAVALAAGVVYVGRRAEIEFLVGLELYTLSGHYSCRALWRVFAKRRVGHCFREGNALAWLAIVRVLFACLR